jgi:hypothetical protein
MHDGVLVIWSIFMDILLGIGWDLPCQALGKPRALGRRTFARMSQR